MAPTSLDTHEITVEHAHADDVNQRYRFRSARNERARWLDLLPQIEPRPRRIARFQLCGTDAWLQYSPSRLARRIVSNTCKQRQCPACRSWWFRRTVNRLTWTMTGTAPHAWKLITLTKAHTSEPLAGQLHRLKADFRRLRQRRGWKDRVAYGYAVVEIARNRDTGHWHPHLHVLCRSAYFPQRELSELWRAVTRGSFIVDVRQVQRHDRAAEYVAKYVAKPPTPDVLASDELASEWYNAMRAQRALIAFGNDRPYVPATETDGYPDDWRYDQPLAPILDRLEAGDLSAAPILTTVRYVDPLYDARPRTEHPP